MKKNLALFLIMLLIGCINIAEANVKHNDRQKHSPPIPLSVQIGSPGPGQGYNNDVCTEGIGWIHPYVAGGTPPYTYLWSNNATTLDLDSITAGTYTITVYDAAGDSATDSQVILSGPVTFDVSAPPAYPCNNQCTGTVYFTNIYFWGTPPYTFTSSYGTLIPDWNAASNSVEWGVTTLTGLCDSIDFTVIATDAMGCTGQQTFNLPGTPDQNPVFNITPACNSLANGSVTISNINTNWGYGVSVDIIADTLNYSCVSGPAASYSSGNLLPGLYYLAIVYAPTDYTCWYSSYGCPQFYPFTIPDVVCNSTVEGDVYLDLNIDCNKDTNDIAVPGAIIQITPGPWYAYTNSLGHYFANVPYGNYNMVQILPSYLTQVCPANPVSISLSSVNPTDTVDFADTSYIPATPIIPLDAEAHIGYTDAHPGFNFIYGVRVNNLGNVSSGLMTVTLDYDPILSFVSANPTPFSTSPGQVVWQLSPIANFQYTNATVTLSVPPNPLLIGYTLTASTDVQTANADTNLANNTASTSHLITGSFDPNVKTVENPPASFLPILDSVFTYTIQFQNTGNDTAFNIEVIDSLDSDLDVTTFVPGASSHPYSIDITGQGVLHFYFNNILLPDSNVDEPRSHGFVSFQIRCYESRPHNTAINNTSNIVFDFNPPVNTNTTTNTVDLSLAINASATTICAGQQVTLTMIPELQNTSWKWRAGNCTSAIIGSGNSITVSPAVTTTYFVRDSAGTVFVGACYRKTITVIQNPTANVTPNGPTTFCQGNSVTLTASFGNSYAWSNGSTTQSINVTSPGNYVVTVTNASTCTATSSAVSVTVNPLPNASITPGGPTTFCQGGSVTLTAGGANNYLWSNSSASQSINVTSSGNYIVTVTDGNSCSAIASQNITVNPLPTASITPGGPTTFCQGNSVTLTSSAANSYLWSNSSSSQSINITSSGNYFVTVTDANNCTASSSAISVTVNPLPTASITPGGPTTFCTGNSVMLTSSAASSYLWTNSSTTQSINVTSSGNYAVTITDVNSCTASTSLSVTVNPLPTAVITPSGPTTFCAGNSVTLTSNAASSYLWSNSSTAQSINVNTSGNYAVTITDANNCSSASPAISVTVNPNPPVPAITQSGDSLISDAANSYQWYFNNVLIPGATLQSYHPPQNGNYSVVIMDANNCTASSADYPFVLTGAGNLTNESEISIYPNPARGELVVRCQGFGDKPEITICNLLGESLFSQKPKANSPLQIIDVSVLPRGIYFIKIKLEEIIVIRKIVLM